MQKRAQTYPHHGTAQQLSLVRLALRHGRGISVAFGPPLASAPPTRQLTALEVCGVGFWGQGVCFWLRGVCFGVEEY